MVCITASCGALRCREGFTVALYCAPLLKSLRVASKIPLVWQRKGKVYYKHVTAPLNLKMIFSSRIFI